MWRWLLVRMLCLPGLRLSWRVMVRWMPRRVLRVLLMVWRRMLWRLVMLLGVRRSRRVTLRRALRLLGCLLVMRRAVLRLLGRVLRRRLAMRLRRPVLVILRCLLRTLRRVALRLLVMLLAGLSRRRLVWIRWCPTLPVCWRGRLRTT